MQPATAVDTVFVWIPEQTLDTDKAKVAEAFGLNGNITFFILEVYKDSDI